ncbi:MAG TPA: protein-glutamate O-methyltransferase CheR [Firmicutes bacterium]|nr:protein-glutamate O-methyltransferase CheR [Bacillota bacterium]
MALEYERLKDGINAKLGIDLHAYKEQQMRRRINQWLNRHDLPSYEALLAKIDADQNHRSKFLKYLTINTSHFFRDESVFSVIENKILPAIGTNNRPRIWSAGASIGAEVYSIAILLQELRIQPSLLLATDLDLFVLNKAKEGLFLPNQVKDVRESLKQKYFSVLENGDVAINDSIKEMVIFKQHDLLKDPYQNNFDLILCRNVFIYFTSETQARLIKKFVKSLTSGGYFIVGSAEQIMDPASYGLDRVNYCIYRKTTARG